MPHIHFLPDDRSVAAEPAENILQASLRSGIPHTHVCGGKARCSTCRVLITAGLEHCPPRNAVEQKMAEQLHFSPDIRLACQTMPSGDVKLRRLVLDADDVVLTDQLLPDTANRQVGVEKRVAVLFADIRGFTAFAETRPPYDVIHALNRYFCRMEGIVRSHHGYIDNYMGDGLLAIFGTVRRNEAPLDAVLAGVEMLAAVAELGPYYASTYGQCFRIGIGLHCGNVVLGSVGPPGRERVTAIGDAVNFASRIEAANKQTGTSFLVSEDVYHCLRDRIEVRRFDAIALPGRKNACVLYEVRGMKA